MNVMEPTFLSTQRMAHIAEAQERQEVDLLCKATDPYTPVLDSKRQLRRLAVDPDEHERKPGWHVGVHRNNRVSRFEEVPRPDAPQVVPSLPLPATQLDRQWQQQQQLLQQQQAAPTPRIPIPSPEPDLLETDLSTPRGRLSLGDIRPRLSTGGGEGLESARRRSSAVDPTVMPTPRDAEGRRSARRATNEVRPYLRRIKMGVKAGSSICGDLFSSWAFEYTLVRSYDRAPLLARPQ